MKICKTLTGTDGNLIKDFYLYDKNLQIKKNTKTNLK